MQDFRKAKLSERDHALYVKLCASCDDLLIARSCAKYIKKKGWHGFAYERRGSVPIQQTSFITTMIVAYGRPFVTGGGSLQLPQKLIKCEKEEYRKLHDRLLLLRNKEYAHSDADTYDVTPYTGTSGPIHMENIRDVQFSKEQIDMFLLMTEGMLVKFQERMNELRLNG